MKKMKSFILALTMCMAVLAFTANAAEFKFTDVPESEWYFGDVKSAVEMGLINGKSTTDYKPNDNLTYAEAIKLAACMHQLYMNGMVTLKNGDPWYQTYVDYCFDNNIINTEYDYDAKATRSGYMVIFAHALPEEALAKINSVPNDAIPDVPSSRAYAPEVYKLYRAGILQGSDAVHSCKPFDNILRSEVAAILSRMMDETKRVKFSMGEEESPEEETPEESPEENTEETEETAPLTIKKQPKDVTVEKRGIKATFSVEVEGGKAPYNYQWYVVDGDELYIIEDDGDWINGANTNKFSFIPDEACEEDIICIIEDADGNAVETNIVTIICEDKAEEEPEEATEEENEEEKEESKALAIKLNPVSVSVAAKETTYFGVEAEGGKTPYTYQWQILDGEEWKDIVTSAFYQGVTTNKLKAIYTRDCEETLRCVVTDADGTTVVSGEAKFVVTFEAPELAVRMQPEDASVTEESSVKVTVAAMGGAGDYSYQWQYANGAAWSTLNEGLYGATGVKTQTLTLTPTEAGTITVRCIISDKDGTPIVTDPATITVEAAESTGDKTGTSSLGTRPSTVSRPTTATTKTQKELAIKSVSDNQTGSIGIFRFAVEVEGGKAPYTYQWQLLTRVKFGAKYINKYVDLTDADGKVQGAKTANLSVSLTELGTYSYKCVITDADGNSVTTDTVTATVNSESTGGRVSIPSSGKTGYTE